MANLMHEWWLANCCGKRGLKKDALSSAFLGWGRERGYFCPTKPCKGSSDLAAKQKGRIRQERAPRVCWHLLHHLAGFADAC